ncbi:MAG TPA: glucosaminidase domain-containing protein [Ktedonobacteraceae bacterium]
MASGNYRDQPVESLPPNSPQSNIPRRTRALTQKIGQADPSSTGQIQTNKPQTQGNGVDRPQRTAVSKGVVTVQEPEPIRPPQSYYQEEDDENREPRPFAWQRSWLLIVVCVVIGALVLAVAGIYVRQPNGSIASYPGVQSFPIQLGGSYQAFNTWNNSKGPLPSRTALPAHPGPYSVLGKPTMGVAQINTVLASYASPTAGMGQSLYNLGIQYGIDPVYAVAFFMHESQFGTTGEARVTLSLGNERCIPDRACIDKNRGGYAQMNSWQDGFEHWYKLIRNLYVAQWGLVTVDQIIPRYAPNSDGNNEKEYIATLKREVDFWRAGGIKP